MNQSPKHNSRFSKLTKWVTAATGSHWAFGLALATVIIWLLAGPYCKWSDTWQLVINTGTTIVTFLMVFLIQAAQNRDSRALQLKLDELIYSTDKARDRVAGIERKDVDPDDISPRKRTPT